MANSADPDQLASSVCKVKVYPGSAGQELIIAWFYNCFNFPWK